MMKSLVALCSLWFLVVATGCMPGIRQVDTTFKMAGEGRDIIEMGQAMTVPLSTGYSSVIKAGSRWELLGKTGEGSVYRPLNQIFTIEGTHVHEAYLVISEGRLMGFYLPVEKKYSPLEARPVVPIKNKIGDTK